MNIVVEVKRTAEYPSSIVPDSIKANINEWESDSIDGDTVYLIYTIAKEVLSAGADIAAIAGFIYLLINEYKAKVSINGDMVAKNSSKEEITDMIKKTSGSDQK